MTIELWPLDRIKPYPGNPRKIPESAIKKVMASLLEFGWQQPIVVDKDGVIIVGHTRREAARRLGWSEAPVHIAANLTPEQARQYRLADNRTNEESAWDQGLLGAELRDLIAAGADTGLTGFDPNELEQLSASAATLPDEAAPAPPVEPTARAGDLWSLGPHRVLCGDATSREAVEALLAGHSPRLMVTDPPYGIELDQNWRHEAGLHRRGAGDRTAGHQNTQIEGDSRSDWSEAFGLVASIEVAYVWHASRFTDVILQGLLRLGFLYPQQIIWSKHSTIPMRTHYWFSHEPCWYVRKKNAAWYGKPGAGNTTVWEAPSPKRNSAKEKAFDHPNQKPIELARKPLRNHTKKGELLYDPFLGSGTTLMACEELGRVCAGMEIDPRFVDVVILRWQELSGKEATLAGRSFAAVAKERAAHRARDSMSA